MNPTTSPSLLESPRSASATTTLLESPGLGSDTHTHGTHPHDMHTQNMHTHDHLEAIENADPKAQLVKSQERFRDELFAAGILLPMRTPGLVGRSAVFERVVAGVVNAVV